MSVKEEWIEDTYIRIERAAYTVAATSDSAKVRLLEKLDAVYPSKLKKEDRETLSDFIIINRHADRILERYKEDEG